MTVIISKLKELPNALNPNNIAEGFERVFKNVSEEYFAPPTLGDRFYPDPATNWSTSGVQEIIDEKTFRTYSSIYQWEIIK